ncbi:MAG: sigma-70 family RNA polymerase sigma factor, partial [Clostridia bacterium]|nr:sigma-70 family RNA polymerase sigma factor [Clostridia bacterium]
MYNKVEICGVNTATLKVLTETEKQQLLRRVKEGDKQAREELVNGNLRLVLSVIQRFTGRGENLDDLFQIGCIGLIKSIDNFDISQNVRFSTYAVPMVIECRNPRKDFESYDQKNRIITGNFATLRGPKEYRDLRETQRHFR